MTIDAELVKALAGAGAAVLVLFCLGIVAWLFKSYIHAKESKVATEVVDSAAALVKTVESLTRDVSSLADDVAKLVTSIAVINEQRSNLMDRTLPALQQHVDSNTRRVGYLERDVTAIQSRLGISSQHTPPMGVPILVRDDD